MKHFILLIILLLAVLPFLVVPTREEYVAGYIRIPQADIRAEIMTASHGSACGCCGILWNGGIASTAADLTAVRVDSVASLITLDGCRLVLECAEIIPCLRIGSLLFSWQGILQAQGDVLIVSGSTAYRFVIL